MFNEAKELNHDCRFLTTS